MNLLKLAKCSIITSTNFYRGKNVSIDVTTGSDEATLVKSPEKVADNAVEGQTPEVTMVSSTLVKRVFLDPPCLSAGPM